MVDSPQAEMGGCGRNSLSHRAGPGVLRVAVDPASWGHGFSEEQEEAKPTEVLRPNSRDCGITIAQEGPG